jgi:hypothetical protein
MSRKEGKIRAARKVEDVGSKWDLDGIDSVILKHLVKYPSSSNQDLGDLVGLTERAIRARRAKPEFDRAYKELTATTEAHLKEAARRAASRLKRLVDDEDKDIALAAIKMALSPYINKAQIDMTVTPRTVYRTSIQVDGSLLQEVVAEEIKAIGEGGSD